MPKFTFKLDPLLRQRRRVERDLQLELAGHQRRRTELEQRLTTLSRAADDERAWLRDTLDPSACGPRQIDTAAARWQAHATMSTQARAQAIAVELAGVLARLDTSRAKLAAAATARRAVEGLRERRLEQFNAEQRKREIAESDDLSSARMTAATATEQRRAEP